MKAILFPQSNKVLKAPPGQEQDVYDLHVWGGEVEGIARCISCWKASPEERAAIAAGGPVWLWVRGTTHPPLVLDARNPFEETRDAPPSLMPPVEALAVAGKLLQRLTDEGRLVSLRAVREAIPLEPQPIFEGAKARCQRHRKGRLFILIEEVEGEPSLAEPEPTERPTVADSFREFLERVTLTPEEEKVVENARIAPSYGDDLLLAIIDRLTGRSAEVDEP